MNTKIFNVLALLFLIGSVACTSIKIDQLEAYKLSQFESDLDGQSLIDTVQIQLATGGSVDTVIRLLQGLENDLDKQQTKADVEKEAKNVVWNKEIKDLNKVIDGLKKRIGKIEQQILTSHQKISETSRSIKINQKQISIVTQKIQDLDKARAADKTSTASRVARQEEMLKAINFIIAELQKMLSTKSFVQLNDIREQLSKLVRQNPIEALVQLTMTFQPDSVLFAVQKLIQIRDSIVASLKEEVVQEQAAQRQHQQLKNELNAFNTAAHATLDKNQEKLASLQKQLAEQKKDLKQTQELRDLNQKFLNEITLARNTYNRIHGEEKNQRKQEKITLQKVVDILKEGSGQISRSDINKFSK